MSMHLLDKFPQVIFTSSDISDGNMSFTHGDNQRSEILKNRKKFFEKLNIPLDFAVAMGLEHKANIVKVTINNRQRGIYSPDNAIKADALITDEPQLYLFVLTADCIPLALYDPKNQAIALIHISWKTAHQDIINLTVKKMSENFGTNPKDLIAQFGPSLGPCCYKGLGEISQKEDPRWQSFISESSDRTFTVDLWGFTKNELKKIGLNPKNIDNPKICSYHSGNYFSYKKFQRENLENDPRFATVLGLKY